MINKIKQKKIRIKLKTYDSTLLKISCNNIITTINSTKAKAVGPISMPTKRKIYCLLRSPHVDKDSREHFQIKIHTKIIDIYESSIQTINALMKLNILANINIEIKL
uniref:30S ribosomal protein S10, chloroplastic n=1 Tax=Harveyella mirabilis TaxID=282355 RepID=A0A3S8UVY4_9FLOR|nr:ribosomal protein S10 [Harveyella mirabilis]